MDKKVNIPPREAVKNYWKVIDAWAKLYYPKDRGSQYAFDVVYSDKYLSCKAMINTCKRHILYMYKYYNEADFEYEYSTERVNFIFEWWEEHLKLTEGRFAGRKFKLEPNQAFKLSEIFGWTYKKEENGFLKFMVDKVYDSETRKNGKSQFMAGLSLFISLNPFMRDAQPEIYFSGPDESASKLIYTKSQQMALKDDRLQSEFKKINTRNFRTNGNGVIQALPFKVEKIEGRNPSFGVLTEYHLHQTDLMINSFESAKNDTRQSLIIFDTTKGIGINGPAHIRENQYKELIDHQVNKNPFETSAENILALVFEVDEWDDYDDIMNPWETNPLRKSTPMLGVTVKLKDLQNQWIEARNNPGQRIEFLIKKFGRWMGSLQGLVSISDIKQSNERNKDLFPNGIEDLKGSPAIIGIDLAQTGDTNSIQIIFKKKHEGREILCSYNKVFIPNNKLIEREEKEKLPYRKWIEQDFVRSSGVKTVDYKAIADYIIWATDFFEIKEILYDPYQSAVVEYHLINIGKIPKYKVVEVPQGPKDLSAPMDIVTKKILDGDYYDFNNPIQATQILNVRPIITSSGGSYFIKNKNFGRIDSFAALVTGVTKFNELNAIDSQSSYKFETWTF